MRRRWLSLLLCLQVCLCALTVVALVTNVALAQTSSTRVDEAATRISLAEGHGKISLVVENNAPRATLTQVTLELLDTHDKAVARTQRRETLKPGANVVTAFLPAPFFGRTDDHVKRLLWYRLRYTLAPHASTGDAPDDAIDDAAPRAAGIISLSQITPDLFALRVSAASKAAPGQLYRVRARATHPLTSRPVRGVEVTAEVVFDDDEEDEAGRERALKSTGTTGRDGYVTLEFKLPARIESDEGEIKVTARLGDIVQTASDDISFHSTTRILLTSDKPLYQPGQTLHLRALLLDHTTRRAIADAEATLKIEDPEGTTVFNAPLKTSRFGVASADWPIADNTRLGDYVITVAPANEEEAEDNAARQRVKISRYELPNFTVSATTDRGYYLPGESALVEVRGDYLFGQPVRRGRVRLVRETEREWNYREQRLDIKEGDRYEGELGADGSFRVRLNFSKEHAEMAANSWQRFDDLNYAAYVTDPDTNRTEHRRFQVRLTKEPIHVYVTQGNYRQAGGLPLVFYVATSYADGTPASCELELTPEGADGARVKLPANVRTNAYGLAKIVGSDLNGEADRYFYLRLAARDREGRAGRHTESIWLAPYPVLRIETDKTIYRAGEPITAHFSSNRPDVRIFVDVLSDNRVVSSETLRLRGGRAQLELPYRPEFQNRVTLAAYATDFDDRSYYDYRRAARTVVYPRNRELKFDVRFGRANYRPGEEAAGQVRVRSAAGRGVESALGVVVFDKAVEERARTEQEFASPYGFSNYFYQFWYGAESIGGISLRDIEQLDAARTPPAALDTIAELLLQRDDDSYDPNFFSSATYETNQAGVFAAHTSAVLGAAREALDARYKKAGEHPTDRESLRRLLAGAGISLEELRDPWGNTYETDFYVERAEDVLRFRSAGADKRAGTDDDWTALRLAWNYFRPLGELINRALTEHHARTGGFIRDPAALKHELARVAGGGFDPGALQRDRWGEPYVLNFHINGTHYVLDVLSGGADRRFTSSPTSYDADDFLVWTVRTDYFAEARERIDRALVSYLKATRTFPRDESALQVALRRAGLEWANLKDPWQSSYYAAFHEETRYANRVRVESGSGAQQQQQQQGSTTQRSETPVTRRLQFVTLRSAGADGKPGTSDDFNVAEFSRIVSDQSAHESEPQAVPGGISFSGDTGAIGGTILDPAGAAIPGATVTATHQHQSERVFETKTDEEGNFLLRNLPPGPYSLRADAPGFKQAIVPDVLVYSATLARANFNLEAGAVAETVTVTSVSSATEPTDYKIQRNILEQSTRPKGRGANSAQPPVSTPRLRKDFPETLYWQPALETDARGRAELRFKLADNITTWKMSLIGSTETGELGTYEQEIRAFQPFFVEHDPPRVLTEGDEISLPVVLRNYLEQTQTVALDIKPEDWFTLLGPARKESRVAAGDAARETFDFRAVASVKEGLQRITAIGGDASDEIERSVEVHPDGEEVAETTTQILRDSSLLEVSLPAETIPRTARAELKIYPNLTAHTIESVEGIMARPYGCAEQTISSTYPSLLVLGHYRRAAAVASDETKQPPVAAKAARYVRQGYERLLSYRSDSGAFSYWGRGEPDLALTAYALRFLTDASRFTSIDEAVTGAARDWLIRQQNANGSWTAHAWDRSANGRRDAVLTAYVARILAMQQRARAGATTQQSGDKTQLAGALRRALAYLAPLTEESDEPYLIASYALAAIDGGEPAEKIARAVGRLRALAHDEAGGSYWKLETNTPFCGWGSAGRIETTALVVQALTKAQDMTGAAKDEAKDEVAGAKKDERNAGAASAPSTPSAPSTLSTPSTLSAQSASSTSSVPSASSAAAASKNAAVRSSGELIDRGLLFLLKSKDRYGVWLSTQATVNVLDALSALSHAGAGVRGAQDDKVSTVPRVAATGVAGESVEIFVNGRSAGTLTLPASNEPANPVSFDLSRFVSTGANRVEIRRAAGGANAAASAQLVTTYYRPWSSVAADGRHARPQDSRALRLNVRFDRTTAATGESVTCHVAAERIGHQGYGMLLAEVGLPPGADVDRASLELAMKESGWEFSHYDVLPDRLVVYLWPRAGGTNFRFTFRPRFGLAAKSAPSLVYDYYNPEARAVLAPTKFNVEDKRKPAPAQAGRE